MDNKVVQTLARAFVQLGWRSVRFNFRGIGASQGAWDEGRGEVDDALAVIAAHARRRVRRPAAARRLLVRRLRRRRRRRSACPMARQPRGWCWSARRPEAGSAGGAGRHLVIHGEADDVVPLAATLDWARPQALPVIVFPGVGHFFHGQLALLKNVIVRELHGLRRGLTAASPLPIAARSLRLFSCPCDCSLARSVLSLPSPLRRAPRRRSRPRSRPRAIVLVDLTSDQTLAERDADAPADPASLTKLMTAYVVFSALQRQEADARADAAGVEARLGRAQGRRLADVHRHDDDAEGRRAAARHDRAERQRRRRWRWPKAVGGTLDEFVAMMNRQAQAWGLKNTALQERHRPDRAGPPAARARDLAVIAAHIIRDFPEYFPYYSIKEYKYNNIAQPNRNLLLRRDPTRRRHEDRLHRGRRLLPAGDRAARVPEPRPSGGAGKRRLLTVVLNTTSMEARASESQKLLNWGFQAFDAVRLFDDGKPIVTPAGLEGHGATRPSSAPPARCSSACRKGEGDKLQTKIERTDPLVAPLAKGQRVGTHQGHHRRPARRWPRCRWWCMEAVEQAGIFGRAWDAMRLWIK